MSSLRSRLRPAGGWVQRAGSVPSCWGGRDSPALIRRVRGTATAVDTGSDKGEEHSCLHVGRSGCRTDGSKFRTADGDIRAYTVVSLYLLLHTSPIPSHHGRTSHEPVDPSRTSGPTRRPRRGCHIRERMRVSRVIANRSRRSTGCLDLATQGVVRALC